MIYSPGIKEVPPQTIFRADNLKQVTQSLANYMPGGRLFEAKNIADSDFRKLLAGWSQEILRAELKLEEFADEIYIQNTTKYIKEWENVVGIPDECFQPVESTYSGGIIGLGTPLETRRKWVITKMALMNTLGLEDWEFIAEYLGFEVEIRYGTDYSEIPALIPMFIGGAKWSKFTMVIVIKGVDFEGDTIPLPIPATIGSNPALMLECIYNKIKPVDVNLEFILES